MESRSDVIYEILKYREPAKGDAWWKETARHIHLGIRVWEQQHKTPSPQGFTVTVKVEPNGE